MQRLTFFVCITPLLFAFGTGKKPKYSKFLTKHYVEIPAGDVVLNTQVEMEDGSLSKDSCETFYMAKGEVSNIDYKEFLMYLKQEGRMEEYVNNLPDTAVWKDALNSGDPFVNFYYQHSAYADYPLVGVTLKQAEAYANWLTEIFALKNQDAKITFSIPSKKQWIRAARGENQAIYPWGGPNLRNSKGAYLANFKSLDAGNIHYDAKKQKYEVKEGPRALHGGLITAPTQSYYPNAFGLYNMSGNVAEMVSEGVAMGGSWNDTGYDIRVESEQSADQQSATVGFRVVATVVKR